MHALVFLTAMTVLTWDGQSPPLADESWHAWGGWTASCCEVLIEPTTRNTRPVDSFNGACRALSLWSPCTGSGKAGIHWVRWFDTSNPPPHGNRERSFGFINLRTRNALLLLKLSFRFMTTVICGRLGRRRFTKEKMGRQRGNLLLQTYQER